jgi:hypothetical protein
MLATDDVTVTVSVTGDGVTVVVPDPVTVAVEVAWKALWSTVELTVEGMYPMNEEQNFSPPDAALRADIWAADGGAPWESSQRGVLAELEVYNELLPPLAKFTELTMFW